MKKKISSILFCMFLIATVVLPVAGTLNELNTNNKTKFEKKNIQEDYHKINRDTVILYPKGDSFVAEGYPDTNYGPESSLYIQSYTEGFKNERTYLKFDMSGIPDNATITDVTLRLYCWSAQYSSVKGELWTFVESWDEDSITWNNQPWNPDDLLLATRNMTLNDTKSWCEWIDYNLVSYIQDCLDDGNVNLMLKTDPESANGQYRFNSREWGEDICELEIHYKCIQDCELLIIAHDSFCNALKPLQTHKNNTGIKTIIRSFQSLENEYLDKGRDIQERIKKAIADYEKVYDIQYVMLVGDCDTCPIRYIKALTTTWGIKFYPSDLYYADLYDSYGNFDDWDGGDPPYGGNGYFGEMDFYGFGDHNLSKLNRDKIDGYPDVAVGRIPASTVQEVISYVNKVISYEINSPYSNWFDRALWVVDNHLEYPPQNPWGNITFKNLLDGYLSNHNIIKAYDVPEWNTSWERDQRADYINNILNDGVGFVNWYGHGQRYVWAGCYNQNYPHFDMNNLYNKDMLPVIFALSCLTARFHFELDYYMDTSGNEWNGGGGERPEPIAVQPSKYDIESLAEEFLVKRDTGAIAYIGCTSGVEDGGRDLDKYFFEGYYYGGNYPILGFMWNYALKEWMDNYNLTEGYAFHHMHKMMLFGDPSLRVGGYYPHSIDIDITHGFGASVKAVVRNEGNITATDIEWSITITGGLLGLVDKEENDTIPYLGPDESETISLRIFGFGPISIIAKAADKEIFASGFQILYFSIIL